MYTIAYKRSSHLNGPILEWSQGRMVVSPWENMELCLSQYPLHHAQKIKIPFLILHGTSDGAVDWNQGLEFYSAARRLGKEVILLSYPGEPHHLAKEVNPKDFQIRMKQYFDHYLKDSVAPLWMKKGIPHLDKKRLGPDLLDTGN
jgi:alpha-beta hydrolase superfamily lysophospholipase